MRYSDMSQLLSKLIRFLSFFFLTLLILVVILKLDLVIPISLAGAPSGIQLNPYNGSSAFDDLTTSIAFQSKNSTSSLASSAMKPLSDSTQLIHDISENVVLALIEKRYVDTLRLWFLYHAIEQKVEIPGQCGFLKSAVWLAVNELALCPQGLAMDQDGVGIWPLVFYNYLLLNPKDRRYRPRPSEEGLESFKKGNQLRSVGFYDILSQDEIISFEARMMECTAAAEPWTLVPDKARTTKDEELDANGLLKKLLEISRKTLDLKRVKNQNIIASLILELELFMADQITDISPYKNQIIELLNLPMVQWNHFSIDRQVYLLKLSERIEESGTDLQPTYLKRLDEALLARSDEILEIYVSMIADEDSYHEDRTLIWSGDRGEQLLALGPNQTFREASIIALYRGEDAYHKKKIQDALRYFALALNFSAQSQSSQAVERLAISWIKSILIQFQFNARQLNFLAKFLNRSYFQKILPDLVWSSALHKERYLFSESFDQSIVTRKTRILIEGLKFLASGQHHLFLKQLEQDMSRSTRNALKMTQDLVNQLKSQPYPIIENHSQLLQSIDQRLLSQPQVKGKRRLSQLQEVRSELLELLANFQKFKGEQADLRLGKRPKVHIGSINLYPPKIELWPFKRPTNVKLPAPQPIKFEVEYSESESAWTELSWILKL